MGLASGGTRPIRLSAATTLPVLGFAMLVAGLVIHQQNGDLLNGYGHSTDGRSCTRSPAHRLLRAGTFEQDGGHVVIGPNMPSNLIAGRLRTDADLKSAVKSSEKDPVDEVRQC
jgi:hypothetical protein